MGVVVLLQTHDGHRLGLVFLDLLGQCHGQGLNAALAAHAGGRKACFHTLVFTADALDRHADLCLPTLLGLRRGLIQLRQRVANAGHLLAKHLAVTPGDKAVDKAKRVDGPSRVILDFGLVCTKDPMAGLVHLDDDDTGWPNIGLKRP